MSYLGSNNQGNVQWLVDLSVECTLVRSDAQWDRLGIGKINWRKSSNRQKVEEEAKVINVLPIV